jgi:uncharacterized membrane protein (UPF0127 family)
MPRWYYALFAIAAVCAVIGFFLYSRQNPNLPVETITIGHTTLGVEVATTDPQRELGLSNRTSLENGKGMLFVFEPPKVTRFWMKDMRFSIDMIFADADGVVLNIAHDVAPETFPATFASKGLARYVLEVPAGYAAQAGIAEGQKIVVQ